MVHGENAIEFPVLIAGKECIRAIRTEDKHIMFGVLDCRLDDIFFLPADNPFVAGVRVETKYRYFWLVNPEIFLQAGIEDIQFGENDFAAYCRSDVLYRDMLSHEADPHVFSNHEHQHVVHAKTMLEKRCMPGVGKIGGLDVLFMNGCRYQALDLALPECFHSCC